MINQEERIAKAIELFKNGYNCAQAVVAAYADMYGFTEEQALRMSAVFGGGIGRMRQTCGAACGMFLLAGLDAGSIAPHDTTGKNACYKIVQDLAAAFKERNGSLICAELLGLTKPAPCQETGYQPIAKKRPCVETVAEAARIYGEYLQHKQGK